jgi:hypothetical protein
MTEPGPASGDGQDQKGPSKSALKKAAKEAEKVYQKFPMMIQQEKSYLI